MSPRIKERWQVEMVGEGGTERWFPQKSGLGVISSYSEAAVTPHSYPPQAQSSWFPSISQPDRGPLSAVHITLDPHTANPWLILSEDRRQVRLGDSQQEVPESEDRFDSYPMVLGSQCFDSGKVYWEVDVQERRPGTWVFVETLCKGRGNFCSAPKRASGQFGCGTNKDMRLAPAPRLPSTFRCLHAELGSSWTMRPALSPSTTALTMAPSSLPSLNVPSPDLCGPSSVPVLMIEEEMQPLLSSVHWRWDGRDPLTCGGTLDTNTPPLVPFLATDPASFPQEL